MVVYGFLFIVYWFWKAESTMLPINHPVTIDQKLILDFSGCIQDINTVDTCGSAAVGDSIGLRWLAFSVEECAP